MNHREMKALAENAGAVRSLATYLLKLPEIDTQVAWSDWELDFLEHMARHQGSEALTIRQAEALVELRDAARSYTSLDGLNIASLINDCWLGRLDLDEEGERFVVGLKASGARSLKRRQALKLLGLARRLGVVERFVAVE